MTAWSRGYAAASPYRIAFQVAQNPGHLAAVCAMAGVDWQPHEGLRVADLGCGRGHAVNALAAANPDWTVLGLDSNPGQLAEGMELAARAGLGNALFLEADLARLSEAELDRIAPLDVVMLHGVWSWVSDEVRAGVVRFLRHCLKPGGIAYLGYNALPAAGVDFALQRLLRHLAGGGQDAAAAALAMERLRAMAPALKLRPSAMLARLLAEPPGLEPGFVAHEFLTAHWRPVFHEDLCDALRPAKLDFVGSCNLFEALPALYCETKEIALLEALPEGDALEFGRDLYLPRAFRADLFIRGPRRVNPAAAMGRLVLGVTRALPAESPALGTGRASVAMAQPVWEALLAVLAAEEPLPLGEVRRRMGPAAPTLSELLAILIGTEHAAPIFRRPERKPAATRFNLAAAAQHRWDEGGSFALASPVAAGGLPASGLELALAAALLEGADPAAPEAVARRLEPGLDEEEVARAAARIAETWAERIPVWRRFGVI
ncbi:MAG: class I SAM-dependent methyltransferase [Roseococcus sp.]|nr:class I SAM-dependent methyltransferase [Roseococcus sp.]